MINFNVSNDVKEADFTNFVMPKAKELVSKTGNLNYMLLLDTSVRNFRADAWFKAHFMTIRAFAKI